MRFTRKQNFVYLPLPDAVVEKYAYKVCTKLAARDHLSRPDTETVRGFTGFMRIAAHIQLKYLNGGVDDGRKET